MARRKKELDALERDILLCRRELRRTWAELRGRKAPAPGELAHAGAKPGAAKRSAFGIAVGALLGAALVVPRIVTRMNAGEPVGDARDRLP